MWDGRKMHCHSSMLNNSLSSLQLKKHIWNVWVKVCEGSRLQTRTVTLLQLRHRGSETQTSVCVKCKVDNRSAAASLCVCKQAAASRSTPLPCKSTFTLHLLLQISSLNRWWRQKLQEAEVPLCECPAVLDQHWSHLCPTQWTKESFQL